MSEILRVLTSEEAKGVGLFVAGGAIALAGMGYRRTLNRFDERVEALEIDEMTGLYMREVWKQKSVDEMIANPGSVFGIIFTDYNNFKKINDTMGHDAGDFHLANGAGVLRYSTKKEDIRGRLGGDEFVALMNLGENGSEVDIKNIVDRLKTTFNEYVFDAHMFYDIFHNEGKTRSPSFESLGAGISVGGALLRIPEDAPREDILELLEEAKKISDEAMFVDKRQSKRRS
ncbi:GGDEF domain-containing protein [Candidatus Saccharibacteria bacterium]|nr:GGDEF domain-containing protein [Candidatus Saccharibacteria bacterium]